MTSHPIDIDEVFGCWFWTGHTDKDGYGRVAKRGKLAHRVVYEEEIGPIEEGKFLDHMCRQRRCVNPRHMEVVTQSENEKRKGYRYRVRTGSKCQMGHDMRSPMITPAGGRLCRECNR